MRSAVVTGGRDYHPTSADAYALRDALFAHGIGRVIHGACVHRCSFKGCRRSSVDVWSSIIGTKLGLEVEAHPYRSELGRAGGPARNRDMIWQAMPDGICVRFPGGLGTANCELQATRAGLLIVRLGVAT